MKLFKTPLPLVALFGLLMQTGCITDSDSLDYWSIVMPRCDYLVAGGGLQIREEDKLRTTLTPQCQEALEEVLPLGESFHSAPEGMKEHVLEAFQILAAYPLDLPPQNRIFGVSPGSIPALHLCLIGSADCPAVARPRSEAWQLGNYRKNIFNSVVNAFDAIEYDPENDPDALAKNHPELTAGVNGRKLIITPLFWNGRDEIDLLAGKFGRTGTLVHEAVHSEGYFHQVCPSTGKAACDADMKGPYGFAASYYELLIHGSSEVFLDSGAPLLSNYDLSILGTLACLTLKQRVLNLPPDLKRLLDRTTCEAIGTRWVVQKEKIDRELP